MYTSDQQKNPANLRIYRNPSHWINRRGLGGPARWMVWVFNNSSSGIQRVYQAIQQIQNLYNYIQRKVEFQPGQKIGVK